jgi:transposase
MEQQTRIAEFGREFTWHNYNLSQTKEKALFVNILYDLCSLIEEKEHNSVGRKPIKTKDVIFAIVMKQYLNISSRRVQSDLRLFKESGFMNSEIPFNTLLDHMERQELKPLFKELIEISSLPLKQIEADFAIDATGFSTSRYRTFFNMKHGKEGKWRQYRKCHAVCGVKTNIITSVDITQGYVHDSNYFEPLAKDTSRNFTIREFSADKGYLSKKAYNLINELGGQAYIPFKSNSVSRSHWGGASPMWRKMLKYFSDNQEEFMKKYHKRSNIESCFSMIKRRFGNNVKCKKETSQDNEIYAKILAHNICVLVQELFLNNINLDFNFHAKKYVARN